MEKILREFAGTAASPLIERWLAIDADRRSRCERDGHNESIDVTIELAAIDEQSETSARIAILDSTE